MAPPRVVNAGDIEPATPWLPHDDGVREVRHYQVRTGRQGGRDWLSGGLLWIAGLVMVGALAGAGYVAYESLRAFAFEHNGQDAARAAIAAALPEAGWISMAVVALVAALRGRSSARARVGVLLFFGLSLGAQLLYAERSIEGYVVAVIPPLVLAWMLESFVVEVRRWVSTRRNLDLDESPILSSVLGALVRIPWALGRVAFWLVRLAFDRGGTWGGLREWVLDTAPLAPGRTAASLRAEQALALADGASQTVEQVRQESRAQIEDERRRAAEQIEAARQEARDQVTAAEQRMAEQLEQLRTESAEQLRGAQQSADARVTRIQNEMESVRATAAAQIHDLAQQLEDERRTAAQQVSGVREELARQHRQQIQQLQQELEDARQQAMADRAQLVRLNNAQEQQLQELRHQVADLSASAPKRQRLIAAYEALGRRGDPRYGDRSAVGEIARELAGQAGLESEGTARHYLAEYLRDMPVKGSDGNSVPSEVSHSAVKIGSNGNGVNGS